MWLRAGRAERKLTLDDVARVTKIQPRILEKIEAGNLDGLPADVFVRGFVKSFARCVGLDEIEAVERYGACSEWSGPTSSVARAFVETLVAAPKSAPTVPTIREDAAPPEQFPESSIAFEASAPEIAPIIEVPPVAPVAIEVVEIPVIEVIEAVEEIPAKKQKRSRKKAAGTAAPRTRKKKSGQELTPAPTSESSMPEVESSASAIDSVNPSLSTSGSGSESASASGSGSASASASAPVLATSDSSVVAVSIDVVDTAVRTPSIFDAPSSIIDTESAANDLFAPSDGIIIEHAEVVELADGSEPVVADPWQPTMPAPTTTSAPWKRPVYKTSAYTVPSLVIDDSDPDMAERERDDREAAAKPGPHRVSFLPPILLDREDKSSRQGGLTLAVILLLIAATLTLSYLMRRPSVSGDGVTRIDVPTLVA